MSLLVRAACLTNYVEVAQSVGLDPWQMLAAAGLPYSCVENPDLKISTDAVRVLLERSAEQSGQNAFGLLMVQGRRISNLGALGLLSREAPTLRAVMQTFGRYSHVHNESLLQRIEESSGVATLYEDLLLDSPGPARQATELLIGVSLRIMRMFLGPDWKARRICFTHSAPPDLSVHRSVLGQMPEFRQEFNGIVCSSADLDTPVPSADPVMAQYIRQKFDVEAQSGRRVSDEVRQMALTLMPRGCCTVEHMAQLMGVSRRTLHRQLDAEGQTFSDLVLSVRRELAQRYVADRRRPLTDIAQLLGFSHLSAFSRWYRQSFGLPADEQRRREAARQTVS